ncbi:MAG: hypothetical protein ACYC0H_21065, partial [Solirubrobacteraceae bacterium]
MGPGTLSWARAAARTLLRLPALAVAVGALVLAGVTTTLAASAGPRHQTHVRHLHRSHALTRAAVQKMIAAYLAAHPPK